MIGIRILAVGRLKTPHWQAAAEYYKKRLNRNIRLEEILSKDAPAAFPTLARVKEEGKDLLRLIRSGDVPICLDERGKGLSSKEFAHWIGGILDTGGTPCFLVGGAYGLSDEVRTQAARILSFGPMTFPHELARVLLLEQLYRAVTIRAGTGYHH